MFCCIERFYPYPSGLLHWHRSNHTIASMSVKESWIIWVIYMLKVNQSKVKHNKTMSIFDEIYSVNIHIPAQQSWWGVYWIHLFCPFVPPSVHLFICRRNGFLSITRVCCGISIWISCACNLWLWEEVYWFSVKSLSKWPHGSHIYFLVSGL